MKNKKLKQSKKPFVAPVIKEKGQPFSFYLLLAGGTIVFLFCVYRFLPVDMFVVDLSVPNKEVYRVRISRMFWGTGVLIFAGLVGVILSRALKKNWILIFASVIMLGAMIEMGMMYFTKSDGAGMTIAHLFWHRKYCSNTFKLTEQLILRGHMLQLEACTLREKPDSTCCKKKKVLMVGDSFTWGDGINDIKNTFPGVLADKLNKKYPDTYAVINLGDRGADAFKEKSNLIYYASEYLKPGCDSIDVTVWQYYLNDIDQISANHNIRIKNNEPSAISKFGKEYLMHKSFLLDYMYAKFFVDAKDTYLDFIRRSFQNDSIVKEHLQPMFDIATKSRENNIRFVAVLFPILTDLPFSRQQLLKITDLLKKNNIEYIDMTALVEPIDVKNRIVNERNLHPSEKVHKLVGEQLFSYLFPQ